MTIRELRKLTGMSQSQFAKKYDIPLNTLQHWEGGYSEPAKYLVKLIEDTICKDRKVIQGNNTKEGTMYYYDELNKLVCDNKGNCLSLEIDLDATSEHNLGLYLDTLFEDYYKARKSFEENLIFDKNSKELIEWTRF